MSVYSIYFLKITYGDNEKGTKSKVERKNTKQVLSKHEAVKDLEVGSVPCSSEHPLLTGHTRRVLFVVIGKRDIGKVLRQ